MLAYSLSSDARAGWPAFSTHALPIAGSCLSPLQQNLIHSQAASLLCDHTGTIRPRPPMCGAWRAVGTIPLGTMATFQTSENLVYCGSFIDEPPHSTGAYTQVP